MYFEETIAFEAAAEKASACVEKHTNRDSVEDPAAEVIPSSVSEGPDPNCIVVKVILGGEQDEKGHTVEVFVSTPDSGEEVTN